MEAKVINQDGVFVVTLSGQLDFESADNLRLTCRKLFREKKVIFNLARLNFVGSSGLTPFLELLSEMNKSHGKDIKLCSVSSEFVRLFEAGDLFGLEIYESETRARQAFTGVLHNQQFISSTPVTSEAVATAEAEAIDKVQPFGLEYQMEEEFAAEEKLE
jgi:anti-anti-sigma factor